MSTPPHTPAPTPAPIPPAALVGESADSFVVHLVGPIDFAASLEMFRRNGDDLLDRWDGATLIRTLPVGERSVAFACAPEGTADAPALRVVVADQAYRATVERALQRMFPPMPPDFAALRQRDPVIERLAARYPGLRPVLQFDLLAALVRSISAQQVNLRWASTTRRRLAETFGDWHTFGPAGAKGSWEVYSLGAATLAAADPTALRALQFTTRKAEYIVGVAQAVASGNLDLAQLATLPDDAVITQLSALRGIGRWTAEWILARTLGRPRVVAGDLGVRKAVGIAYLSGLGDPMPSEDAVREATAHWGASALVAQNLLLHGLAEGELV
ncbi:MAG TPA: hypothetical protein VMV29_04485 [Ktedonobacterales bacterium]|nr:hypothetical protein [Ktedonobacterales bacterium]